MIFNYDTENGFATVLDKLKPQRLSEEWNDAWKKIGTKTDGQVPSWKAWGDSIGYTDKQLLSFLKDVDTGKANISDMGQIIESASKSTSTFQKVTSKVGSVFKTVGGTAVSFLGNMAIGAAIGATLDTIGHVIQYNDQLSSSAQAAGESFKSSQSSIDGYKQQIEELNAVISNPSSSIEEVTAARQKLFCF